jgi:hypothetical protein
MRNLEPGLSGGKLGILDMTVETRGAGFKARLALVVQPWRSGFVTAAGGRYNEDLNIELKRA